VTVDPTLTLLSKELYICMSLLSKEPYTRRVKANCLAKEARTNSRRLCIYVWVSFFKSVLYVRTFLTQHSPRLSVTVCSTLTLFSKELYTYTSLFSKEPYLCRSLLSKVPMYMHPIDTAFSMSDCLLHLDSIVKRVVCM